MFLRFQALRLEDRHIGVVGGVLLFTPNLV